MAEGTSQKLGLANLFRPDVQADPYPFYHRLRTEDPVYRDEEMRTWVLTRYADVVAIVRDPRFLADRIDPAMDALEEMGLAELRPLYRVLTRQILFTDPPDHTRLRRLVNKAFTPRAVEGMRAHIQQIVDGLLDAVEPSGRMDVIRDLAYPLPTVVIAEMLGVPPEDRDRFKKWSDDFAVFLGTLTPAQEQSVQALKSVFEAQRYFHGVVTQLRQNPKENLLSALARAEEQGDMLTEEELLANSILLLAAGHETTTNLIGNGLLALLQHPDQLELLRDDPSLVESAVEELLRYNSPVQLTSRLVKEDLEIGGKQVWHNQWITLLLGAANRDPAQFPDPDRLDITRRDNRHVSFGQGPHFCLGAGLARLEGQIAISTVLRRLPKLRLATDRLRWHETPAFRGLTALPVTF